MKKTYYFLFISAILAFSSCHKEQALFAVAKYQSMDEIRKSVSVSTAKDTDSEGKIYIASDMLLYIAEEEGIHIFNNSKPATPQNITFINIPGVHDIAIKGNYLYADNFIDLLVFDISDIQAITLKQTLASVLQFKPVFPENAMYYSYGEYTPESGEIIVGYTLEYRDAADTAYKDELMTMAELSSTSSGVGVGGSYAKFQIKNNALYTLEDWKLNIFNITEPTQVFFDHEIYMNDWFSGELETTFIQNEHLFIGSTTGMHIIDIENELNPQYISQFSHATACDPVVVNENTAYITVRGGNTCGAIEDQINVIDISDINTPTLSDTYLLKSPYGLGYREGILYVCSNSEGLNIFDASNNEDLVWKNSLDYEFKDLIPLESHLIAVGNQKIIQFNYEADYSLSEISTIEF